MPAYSRSGLPGLSPRVRGNLRPAPTPSPPPGTIPAGAGEPARSSCPRPPPWDYPRGCGGTRNRTLLTAVVLGLSPRVRGNRKGPDVGKREKRTIPAGAGEPGGHHLIVALDGDYPRGCGGTLVQALKTPAQSGLSPRVRGNRNGKDGAGVSGGTIPAGAGEPCRADDDGRARGDYPRGCGGTGGALSQTLNAVGLSPRVRGNRAPGPAPAG